MSQSYPIPTAALDDRLGFVGTAGNNNNYRLSDVTLGMRLDGGIVDFASGKTIKG